MSYRFFAGPTGALVPVSVDADCRTDERAVRLAVRLASTGEHVEVWEAARLVCQVLSTEPSPEVERLWPASR